MVSKQKEKDRTTKTEGRKKFTEKKLITDYKTRQLSSEISERILLFAESAKTSGSSNKRTKALFEELVKILKDISKENDEKYFVFSESSGETHYGTNFFGVKVGFKNDSGAVVATQELEIERDSSGHELDVTLNNRLEHSDGNEELGDLGRGPNHKDNSFIGEIEHVAIDILNYDGKDDLTIPSLRNFALL